MILPVVFASCLAVLVGGNPVRDTQDRTEAAPICLEPECVITSGVMLSAMDQEADPCEDFYRYACGGWLDQAEIPPWSSGVSKSFGELSLANLKVIKKTLESSSPNYDALQKARDYYDACMDEAKIESAGARPLLELIKIFGGWGLLNFDHDAHVHRVPPFDLVGTLLTAHRTEGTPLFTMGITVDDKNSSAHIIQFVQSGLWLGPRELYLGGHESLLSAYLEYGSTLTTLLAKDIGLDVAVQDFDVQTRNKMQRLLDFETELAEITMPKSELHDPFKTYHKMTLLEFSKMIPEIDIGKYLRGMFGMDIPPDEEVLVPTKAYFPRMNELLKKTSSWVIHDYMVWTTVASLSSSLSSEYRETALKFRRAYTGISAAVPRWMLCAGSAGSVLGFVAGAEFVEKEDSIAIKDEIEAMIGHIRREFIDNLPYVRWMDETTRLLAASKAWTMKDKVVAPSWIKDRDELDLYYNNLTVNPNSYFVNELNAGTFYRRRNLAKYKKPVDKTEWQMSPAKVNAYYNPSENQMVFPAGILQTPFYDTAMPMSVNFGSIGWVIGHELTHGFDDTGRKYDEIGNLHNWWKTESAVTYQEHAQCVQKQYDSYKIQDMHVDGLLTLGENIADNGGLRLALQTYKNYRDRQAEPEARLPGLQHLTPEQIFFISAGQTWCKVDTPKQEILKLLTDAHSPGKYRVMGTMSNMEEFSEAFQCVPGSFMNPADKCLVW